MNFHKENTSVKATLRSGNRFLLLPPYPGPRLKTFPNITALLTSLPMGQFCLFGNLI